jgi:4-diphosphocytidyl-2-C-methyl-D-erythritol kinase
VSTKGARSAVVTMSGMGEWSAPYPAPAKLNLMLRVVGRRADGYHLLQTVFRFIDYGDTLRFRLRDDGVISRVSEVAGVAADDDLCVRAARLLQAASGTTLGADIFLEKRLPMGGGLGGGSSDAATTLRVLDRLWGSSLGQTQLIDLAGKLGADVPVFVYGRNAFAEGIGEQLQALTLPPAWYVVLCPPVMVSTPAVFAHPELKRDSEKITIQRFFKALQAGDTVNDLQAVAVREYPEVARHLAWLSQHGAAMMTGSGSCVFAAFETEAAAREVLAQRPAGMQGFVARGLAGHPLNDLI